jgi:hypothetical protein
MTKTNPNAYDPARSQRELVRETLIQALPTRGEPTLAWEIAADGTGLTGRGPREAVWFAAGRIGGEQLRNQVDQGAKKVTCTVPGFGTNATVELTITN